MMHAWRSVNRPAAYYDDYGWTFYLQTFDVHA
jgi:hypothetical protein